MFDIAYLPAVAALSGIIGVVAYCVSIVSDPRLQPGTVNPFGPSMSPSSQDTMASQELVQTQLPERTEWKLTMLTKLRDVEDFLDYLENHKIEHREVHALGNSSFAVRWM